MVKNLSEFADPVADADPAYLIALSLAESVLRTNGIAYPQKTFLTVTANETNVDAVHNRGWKFNYNAPRIVYGQSSTGLLRVVVSLFCIPQPTELDPHLHAWNYKYVVAYGFLENKGIEYFARGSQELRRKN